MRAGPSRKVSFYELRDKEESELNSMSYRESCLGVLSQKSLASPDYSKMSANT